MKLTSLKQLTMRNFWIFLFISFYMVQMHVSAPQNKQKRFFFRNVSVFPQPENFSPARANLTSSKTIRWGRLLSVAHNVFHFMMCLNGSHGRTKTINSANISPKNFAFIYSNEVEIIASGFARIFSCPNWLTKAVTWRLDASLRRQELLKLLTILLDMETDIRNVVVASSHADFIYRVLSIVTTEAEFKWRRLLHATEWFVLTNDFTVSKYAAIADNPRLPDFVTVLSINTTDNDTSIHLLQKSRVKSLTKLVQIPLQGENNLPPTDAGENFAWTRDRVPLLPIDSTNFSGYLRKDAVLYLCTQKSVMAGMQIPAVIVPSEQDRTAFLSYDGNSTSWVGFNIAVMNLLSNTLGFTAQPFAVKDNGFFGVFKPNGDILGVTGK